MANDVQQHEVLGAGDTGALDGGADPPAPEAQLTVVQERVPVTRAVDAPLLQPVETEHLSPAARREALHERYGGFYWGSDFIGFAVAIFFTLVFLGIVGAIVGAVGYQLNAPVPKITGNLGSLPGTTQRLGIGALVGSLIAVFLAYVIGGYTAGRMARFDGIRNGFGVWIWTIIVAIILGIIGGIVGNSFNVASQIHLNVDASTMTSDGAISIAVTLVVMLLGAVLGGLYGARFHKHIAADEASMA